MEQMLTCLQISMQLKGHVELYNQQYPQNNSLRDITDNTIIYNTVIPVYKELATMLITDYN